MSDRELIDRIDRLTRALEKQNRNADLRNEARTAAANRMPPTYNEQARRNTTGPCPHGEPRGPKACPLCRRGIR